MKKLLFLTILLVSVISCTSIEVSEYSDLKTYPEGIPIDTMQLASDTLSEGVTANPWKYLVVHTTGTSQNATPTAISRYWKEHLHWVNPGYHFLIPIDGSIWVYKTYDFNGLIRPEDVVNSVRGMNRYSIAVSYVGGIDDNGKPSDTRTEAQKETLSMIVDMARKANPNVLVVGHNDIQIFTNKACPSFNVQDEYPNTELAEMADDSLHIKIMERVHVLNQ